MPQVEAGTKEEMIGVKVEPPRPDSTAHPRSPVELPCERSLVGDAQVSFRPMQPDDIDALRAAHREMFPVDYEDAFFMRVVHHQDGLESLAAVSRQPEGGEQLAGFITARAFQLHECDPVDRALLGLGHKLLDNERVMYILTLGVTDSARQKGIASALIQWVLQQSRRARCRAVYLHVIDYNAAAIGLYRRNAFTEVACRERFYSIWSGRQLDPDKQVYDAFLYAFVLDTSLDRSLANLLLLALAPLRSLAAALLSCWPWAEPRGSYFGGGELPPLRPEKLSPRGSGTAAPWLLALFSRKGAARQH